jgi:hypothetical protein
MKKDKASEDLKIRDLVEKIDKIELVDSVEMAGVSKEKVIIPYLTSLYKDLILRSDAPEKGIPLVVLTDVFFPPIFTIVVL